MQLETVINIQHSSLVIAIWAILYIVIFNDAFKSIKWKAFWVIILFSSCILFIAFTIARIWM